MRALAIAVLCAVLLGVYWLGAIVYSENIENDISTRTQTEIANHQSDISNIVRVVDGRDVTVLGNTSMESVRSHAGDSTRDVWGVRVLKNQISVTEPVAAEIVISENEISTDYYLHAQHNFPDLRVDGQVDDSAYQTISGIHAALPPDTTIDYSGLEHDAPDLLRSARVVETGIAAVTQMNPGTLTITDTQFILQGTVYSIDRKRTIEQLVEVRRAEIEPLEIIVDIRVESPGITQACRDGINQVLANNVLNYAVDHYRIDETHASVLEPMAETILGVCHGQIVSVLVEGHADYTGGAGYNQGLSERRSGTVKDHLAQQGVDPALINSFGYGEFRPLASNETSDGRSKNRRTEIYLLIQDLVQGETVPAISSSEEL